METYVLHQLAYGAPLLLVYAVGIILSAVFVRKYPFSAMLTLAGIVILFVNVIAIAALQGYFLRARIEAAWTDVQYSQMTTTVSAIGAIVRAIGSALLIAAIFVGRKIKATTCVNRSWENRCLRNLVRAKRSSQLIDLRKICLRLWSSKQTLSDLGGVHHENALARFAALLQPGCGPGCAVKSSQRRRSGHQLRFHDCVALHGHG